MCMGCGHGGCLECYEDWFVEEGECPTGCGCQCERAGFVGRGGEGRVGVGDEEGLGGGKTERIKGECDPAMSRYVPWDKGIETPSGVSAELERHPRANHPSHPDFDDEIVEELVGQMNSAILGKSNAILDDDRDI